MAVSLRCRLATIRISNTAIVTDGNMVEPPHAKP